MASVSEHRHKRDRAILQRRLGEERRKHVNECVAAIIAQGKMEERRQTTRREEDQ